ncbi:MAG: hypothetical protein WCG47_13265, partial [Dermatophilaceae bacterium]
MHRYEGRHRHAQEREARRRAGPASTSAFSGRSGARRPSVHAATAVALVGAGVAGFLSVNADASSAQAAAASLSADQLQELNASVNLAELESDRATGHLQANQRVLAAAGAAQAAAAEAARLEA